VGLPVNASRKARIEREMGTAAMLAIALVSAYFFSNAVMKPRKRLNRSSQRWDAPGNPENKPENDSGGP
jgi:hypothetical protein